MLEQYMIKDDTQNLNKNNYELKKVLSCYYFVHRPNLHTFSVMKLMETREGKAEEGKMVLGVRGWWCGGWGGGEGPRARGEREGRHITGCRNNASKFEDTQQGFCLFVCLFTRSIFRDKRPKGQIQNISLL